MQGRLKFHISTERQKQIPRSSALFSPGSPKGNLAQVRGLPRDDRANDRRWGRKDNAAFGELQIDGWPRIQKPEFGSHDGERNHKGLPARKSASLVRKKSETRIET